MEPTYKSYDDWYDHGPGSEAFKRKCLGPGKGVKFPDLNPCPKRATDPGEVFELWALEWWRKPLLFPELLKQEEFARIRELISRAQDIVMLDSVFDKGIRISRELEKRGNDISWKMCYRGEYDR